MIKDLYLITFKFVKFKNIYNFINSKTFNFMKNFRRLTDKIKKLQ